jgi:hypothetical protein
MMKQILNLDETCMSLDGGDGNRGGRPTHFPQLGKATSKSALTTTMIGGSNVAGEPIPPHFQFQLSAQTPDAEALRIKCICYMLNVQAAFGHEEVRSFPISLGLNNKGGMDDDEFFEYLQKSIMKLYPDAAPVKGTGSLSNGEVESRPPSISALPRILLYPLRPQQCIKLVSRPL